MLTINGKDIELHRGDEVDISFLFENNPPADETAILFAVRKGRGLPVIQKETVYLNELINVHLSSSDTNVVEDIYNYGLYVSYGDGNGYTPLAQNKFIVLPSEAFPGR